MQEGKLNTRSANTPVAPDLGVEGATLAERKRFGCFAEEDARLLAELAPTIERHARAFVDRFYDHLMATAALRPFLADPAVVQRLKRLQFEYLLSLVSGNYGEAYAESRRRIGRIHERIGLDPQWYLGTYGLYIELLLPLVHDHFRAEPAKAMRACVALSKLVILDMQLVLDAYHETRHRKGGPEVGAARGRRRAGREHRPRGAQSARGDEGRARGAAR